MSLWKDQSNIIHDDMDGLAMSLQTWPQGMTKITQVEADEILNPPKTTAQIQIELESNVQSYLDSKAQSKGYDSSSSCISYLNSTNPLWKTDALAMNAWRDSVWGFCYANAIIATPATTWEELIPLLPVAPW